MAVVYLISCVSRKKLGPCEAKDIYTSDWFRKSRVFAERCADSWYILSAEHGLLSPSDVISTYDKTLNRMPIEDRRRWAEGVVRRLQSILRPGDRIVVLAGQRYREYIEPALRKQGIAVEVPMEGLRIGEQLGWLKRHA